MSENPYPTAHDADQIAVNIASARARIDAACQRSGRDPSDVRLLPVSKTVSTARLREAWAAGCRELGENKVQEAQAKCEELADLDIRWSLIGHLQGNKAKDVARFASEFQALHSLRLAQRLNDRLQREGRTLEVFVQVNTSGEASKYGLPPDQVVAFVDQLPAFDALRPRGLMTLAIWSSDQERVRACFRKLHALREQLRERASGEHFSELSMGMSGDFELAVEEGATVVRLGQVIFGARDTPDSSYWPTVGR